MQFIPLCRVPPFGSIAWGFDKLTHHGNPLARALPIGLGLLASPQSQNKLFLHKEGFYFSCQSVKSAWMRGLAA